MGFVTVLFMMFVVIFAACVVSRWDRRAAYRLFQHSQLFFEPEPAPPELGAMATRAKEVPRREKHRHVHLTPYLKKQIAYDQNWKCSCGCGKTLQPDFHIDHTVPLWQGGGDTTDNMTAMNPACHQRKTAIENQRV